MTKLFLGGISPLTSTEVIRHHFSENYGEVLDAIAMTTREGKHRGFGFVTLESEDAAELALAEEVVIDGRVIDMKRADGKGGPSDAPRATPTSVEEFGFGQPPRPTSAPIGGGGYGSEFAPTSPHAGGACGPAEFKRGKGGETNKVFIGGLSRDTTDELLREHFSQFGELTDCVVIRDPETKRPRGFGFVAYDNPESVDAVMECYESHQIAGKWVEVKRATAREAAAPSGLALRAPGMPGMASPHGPMMMGGRQYGAPMGGYMPMAAPMAMAAPSSEGSERNKVFIGGIPTETTDDALHAYFSQYGTLVDCVAMKDKATGRPRGFGFVQYDSPESVDAVMQDYANHRIEGKWVEVKRAAAKGVAPISGPPPMAPLMHMRRPGPVGFGGPPAVFRGPPQFMEMRRPVGPTSIYADRGGYGPSYGPVTTGRTFLSRAHMGPYGY
mmetsp:Transcript_8915/g.16008  ORF Transcript_8915/g.16008 Transcript_8915/m.16008 type:complete len:442 (+) Transcript_8915:135-1460(+)